MQKIGLLGGTFDPIHNGHLLMAEAAREALALSQVIFIPAAQSPFKTEQKCASAEKRLAMVKMAIANNPYFTVSDVELKRKAPSYTIDTICELTACQDKDTEYFFIIGTDAVNALIKWHSAHELILRCHFVVASRQGYKLDWALLRNQFGAKLVAEHVHKITTPKLELSSTDIRSRLAKGASIRYRTPLAVEEYIYQEGLYHEL